jgi:hypothetical protein
MPRLLRRLPHCPDLIRSSNSNARPEIRSWFPSIHTMPRGKLIVPPLFRETISHSFSPLSKSAGFGEGPGVGFIHLLAKPRPAYPAGYTRAKWRQGRGRGIRFIRFLTKRMPDSSPIYIHHPAEKCLQTQYLGGKIFVFGSFFFKKRIPAEAASSRRRLVGDRGASCKDTSCRTILSSTTLISFSFHPLLSFICDIIQLSDNFPFSQQGASRNDHH